MEQTTPHEDILKWQRDHDTKDEARFESIDKAIKDLPCKEDIRAIVENTMTDVLKGKGMLAKNVIVTTAIVIGSITAIVLGVKTIIGWFGITIINR